MPWGAAPVPLLPETLRAEWRGERLPDWVCRDLGVPVGATCASLDASVWRNRPEIPERVLAFIANLLTARRAGLESIPVFPRPIPPEFQIEAVPLSTRVKNALRSQRIPQRPDLLSELKYGELLALKALGVRSALDLSCTIEAFRSMTAATTSEDLLAEGERRTAALLEFLDESEAAQISARDPRFGDVLATVPGTIADYLDVGLSGNKSTEPTAVLTTAVVNLLRGRVADIRALPLDTSLRQLIAHAARVDNKRLHALSQRLGFEGNPPLTLEEAGRTLGVTRERMRQIENKFRKQLPDHDLFLPKLDDAIDLLSRSLPMTATSAAALLADNGISTKPFSPHSLLAAAELAGRTVDFTIQVRNGADWVVGNAFVRHARLVSSIAKKQAQASGASNIDEVIEELKASKKISSSGDVVRAVLTSAGGFEFLNDDWFWLASGKRARNRLRNVARKILSVAAPVDVSVLREGVKRVYRGRGNRGLGTWPLVVPPRAVLRAFFAAHPEFTVDADGLVGPAKPLDYRDELTGTEEVLVDVLRQTSSGVLDRTTYARRCIDRGMNIHTFSQYLSFSPVINHLGTDLWCLRGIRVDPAAVEVLRQMNVLRPYEKRTVDYGWSHEGLLWVSVRVPELTASPVALIPASVRRFVASREFAGRDENGNDAGRIRVNDDGLCYGFAPYLRRRGADADDLLILRFDITTGFAELQLADEELFDSVESTDPITT